MHERSNCSLSCLWAGSRIVQFCCVIASPSQIRMALIPGRADRRLAVLPQFAQPVHETSTPAPVPKKRTAIVREQWCEVFICEEQAAVTLTLADAVLQGHSVLLLDLGILYYILD